MFEKAGAKVMAALVALILLLSLVAGIGASVWWLDNRADRAEVRAATAEEKARGLTAQLKESRDNVRVVTKFVDRVNTIREVGRTIEREVPVYVTQQADAACPIPRGFVQLHDAAAAGVPPAVGAGDPDARAEGIALSTVTATVAGNYGACHENAAQLKALQDKLRALGVSIDG